jgi:hypothetical protein
MGLAGLAGHVLEAVPTRVPMVTTRITVDILGTVPMEPLVPTISLRRDGNRMQIVEVEFACEGRSWIRATAVRARAAEFSAAPAPLTRRMWTEADEHEVLGWFEARLIDCDRRRVGPGALWARFTADVVDGEPLAPLSVMAMMGDFGHGTAPIMPLQDWSLANLDITVYATRPPVGEWLLIDAEGENAGNGVGFSRARIGDAAGMFATSLQSLFVDRRMTSPSRQRASGAA